MNEMNILTLNGTQYEIADKKAREGKLGIAALGEKTDLDTQEVHYDPVTQKLYTDTGAAVTKQYVDDAVSDEANARILADDALDIRVRILENGGGDKGITKKYVDDGLAEKLSKSPIGAATPDDTQEVHLTPEGKLVTAPSSGGGITLTATVDTGSEVTVTDGTDTLTETSTDGKAKFLLPHGGKWDVSAKKDGAESNKKTVDVVDNYSVSLVYVTIDKVLNNNSWADIHKVSAGGEAQNYWSVGDTKQIIINGKVGKTTFDHLAIDVFIIGFNHNAELEGKNLTHFQIGKIGGKDVALYDGAFATHDSGRFNFNPSNVNEGGWEASYRRKILYGNTNAPTAPLSGSLIASLSEELRKAIQPVAKYTDNAGYCSEVPENVTLTTDYLWDLAQFELLGESKNVNQYEQNKQQQYQYYKAGNSKVAYIHSETEKSVEWGTRSPCSYMGGNTSFYCVSNKGGHLYNDAFASAGLRPGFAV